MKIIIKGNNVTPEKIAEAIKASIPDHLSIRSLMVCIQLQDDYDRIIELLSPDGHELTKSYRFQKPKEIKLPQPPPQTKPNPVDSISARKMIELSQSAAHRMLSSNEMKILITLANVHKPEKQIFSYALKRSIQQDGRFSIHHLEQLVLQQINHVQR